MLESRFPAEAFARLKSMRHTVLELQRRLEPHFDAQQL